VQPPPEPVPAKPARTGVKLLLLAAAGAALVLVVLCGGGTVLILYAQLRSRGPAQGAPADPALASLAELQRDWWNGEGLGGEGGKDLAGALDRLLDRQRDWWDTETLTSDGNPDGREALGRLAELERQWWETEGPGKGQPGKNADALARLEEIDRQWWQSEKPTRAAAGGDDQGEGEGAFAAVDGGADPKVRLMDRESSRQFLKAGGTEKSEEAVALGLKWLAAQQQPDGRWTFNPAQAKPPATRGKKKTPEGPVLVKGDDIAATGLALLPFVARGETHKGSEEIHTYTKVVADGINFLVAAQKPNGDLRASGDMYVHAIATIALCEDFNLTSDPVLRSPCQKAIDFIVKAQDKRGGGWRYTPGTPGDLSVTAWVVQALKSGQMAGVSIPRETFENAGRFLQSVALPGDSGYGYLARNPGNWEPIPATMTAAGLLSGQYLQGGHERKKAPARAVERLLAAPPSPKLRNMYYYYYATFALFNLGGEPWEKWNPQMRELLIAGQDRGNDLTRKGSWEPQGKRLAGYSGRLVTTSLALLTLEVYYRHLPLNRPELGEAAKGLDTKKPRK
jgi:hypothetical protein